LEELPCVLATDTGFDQDFAEVLGQSLRFSVMGLQPIHFCCLGLANFPLGPEVPDTSLSFRQMPFRQVDVPRCFQIGMTHRSRQGQ
jgi:hypothetical protein